MIPNGEGLYFIAVEISSALLRAVASKIMVIELILLTELSSFFQEKKKKLDLYKKVCKNKNVGDFVILFKDIKILELNKIRNLIRHDLRFMQIMNL